MKKTNLNEEKETEPSLIEVLTHIRDALRESNKISLTTQELTLMTYRIMKEQQQALEEASQ